MQIVLLEKHQLHRQVLVAFLPLLLAKASLAVKCSTPDEDSTLAGQNHRVEEGAGDLGYVKIRQVVAHASELVLKMHNVVVEAKFLMLVVPCHENFPLLCDAR